MSYSAAPQNRFRQGLSATCGDNEHMDWETGQCAPGWCPAGQEVEPTTGNCVPAGTATSHQTGGSRDVEYVDYTSDGGGGSGGSSRASMTGGSGSPAGMATLVGLACVGVIAYAFWTRVG